MSESKYQEEIRHIRPQIRPSSTFYTICYLHKRSPRHGEVERFPFADDTKIFKTFTAYHDTEALQNELNKLSD